MKLFQIQNAWQGGERCKNCAIRHLVLFSDLQQDDFDRIHHPIDDIEYHPGETLYQQAEQLNWVYTIRSGMVKLETLHPNGNRRIVRLLRQGDLAGLEALNQQAAQHQAVTLDHVRVCRIPISVIATLRRDSPNLHDSLMRQWHNALEHANIWINELSTGPAKERVARLLLLLENTSDDESFFLPTREDMGAMLGVTTESASKAIAEFKRNGWLKTLQNNRAWADIPALKQHFLIE